MLLLDKLNNRNIFYQKLDSGNSWQENLPRGNWLAFVITSEKSKPILAEIADMLIDNNACYISCSGQYGELLHDIADEEIVVRKVYGAYSVPFDLIMTTWDENVEEGFWSSICAANNDPLIINTIVCLDGGETESKNELTKLVQLFGTGYIPD